MRDGRIIEGVAAGDKISSWNDDDNVEQIYLVGTFPNISTPFVVHDTPGVNSALNPIHRDVTQKFLTDNPPALLAFVINAENNGSNDEAHFLRWLGRNLVDKHGTEIIFVLNKMDSPDFKRGDRQGFPDDPREELIQLGFKSPTIFPISAEAALLFRMLLVSPIKPISGLSMTLIQNCTNNAILLSGFFSELRITVTLPLVTTNWLVALRISFYSLLLLFTFNLPTVPK